MKRKLNLNFFDISSALEILPENELFKIKGGNSDMMDGGEIEEVVVEGEYEGGEEEEEDYEDDWEDWDEGSDPEDDEGWDNDVGTSTPNNDDGQEENTFPEELCFTALNNAYPKPNSDGTPAHPSDDSYAKNQCAIRLGAALMDAYDIEFSSSSKYYGNVTSEGYPRGAADLANMLKSNGVENSGVMSLEDFMASDLYNQQGIIYQVAEEGSMAHIDIYKGGGVTGSGFYDNSKIVFFPIDDSGC